MKIRTCTTTKHFAHRMKAVRWGLLALLAIGGGACDRPKGGEEKPRKAAATAPATRPAVLPSYSFADPLLATQFPEPIAFVRRFLETCLVGDYESYRRMVSRFEEPQSRERFQRIYGGLRSIVVEAVEPLSEADLAALARNMNPPIVGAVYRVISSVHFAPETNISLRHGDRRVAILVFREDGEWRMRTAPASLQPRDALPDDAAEEGAAETASQQGPEYPWDLDGDS